MQNLINSIWNIKKWFTDKIGITGSIESTKRKNEECETSNKRIRVDNHLVEISDEAEEMEINQPEPSTMPLKVSPPVLLTSDELNQKRTEPTDGKMDESTEIIEFQNSSLPMEVGSSALNINRSTPSKENILVKIIKNYILPRPVNTELSDSSTESPQSLQRENSSSSQKFDKENLVAPELNQHKNRILKQEMFYERILRKFKGQQVAVTRKQKTPEDAFKEQIEVITNELEKLEPKKKKEIFPGYSNETLDFIKCQISRPVMDHVCSKTNIRIKDLQILYQSNGWLNDEVVDHYISMVVARDSNSLHMFNTFFYFKLFTQGYQSVRRWSKKKDIFACKKMLTPIHFDGHWCLVCVNFVEKTIKYYDSLRGKNPDCLNSIFNYLKEEYKNKKNEDFDCRGWQLMDVDDCPRQFNGYDCGVFACVIAEFLARDAVLDFVQDDIPLLRQKMCYEILKNKLCY